MEMKYKTASDVSREMAIRLGHQNEDCLTFVELMGSKDDIIEVLITGLVVFAVGAIIFALLKG